MPKLPKLPEEQPKFDTNLLQFMFTIARNDHLLTLFLREIQFIREHPNITEREVRKNVELQQLIELPQKPTGTA